MKENGVGCVGKGGEHHRTAGILRVTEESKQKENKTKTKQNPIHSGKLIINLLWVSNIHLLASRLKAEADIQTETETETEVEKQPAWPCSVCSLCGKWSQHTRQEHTEASS